MKPLAAAAGAMLLGSASAAPCSMTEWLSAKDLAQSCEAFLDETRGAEGNACLAFTQGLLAGSDTPQSAASSDAQDDESFLERATQTRVGTPRMRRVEGADDYCLGAESGVAELVRAITDYLTSQPQAFDLTDSQAVREALIRNFPCDG